MLSGTGAHQFSQELKVNDTSTTSSLARTIISFMHETMPFIYMCIRIHSPCIIKAKNSRLQELQVSIKILCNMYDAESTWVHLLLQVYSCSMLQ